MVICFSKLPNKCFYHIMAVASEMELPKSDSNIQKIVIFACYLKQI